MKKKLNILVTNDDGIDGRGLKPLIQTLKSQNVNVWVVVPESRRNAASYSITLHKPIRIDRAGLQTFTTNGMPSDCARIGVLQIVSGQVDLVISGINEGANLADDIGYSGTVGAAREAVMLGYPAIAVSLATPQNKQCRNFETACDFVKRFYPRVIKNGLSPRTFLNVNVPDVPLEEIKGVDTTRQGISIYDNRIQEGADPRGEKYYWLAGARVGAKNTPGTDNASILKKHISVTPISLDYTAMDTLPKISRMLKGI